MQTFTIISIILNVVFILAVLRLVLLKYKEESKLKKIYRERKAKLRKNAERAQWVKAIRVEVRKYLKELQNDV
jgi:predicted membrane protein